MSDLQQNIFIQNQGYIKIFFKLILKKINFTVSSCPFFYKTFILLFIAFFFHPINENVCYAQKPDSIQNQDTLIIPIHSPRKASMYSAVLPGLGQIYNKKYWKVPLIYIGFGIIIYAFKYDQSQYALYRASYIYSAAGDPNPPKGLKSLKLGQQWTTENLRSYADFFENYRDLSILCFAGLYVLNIIDATVDAYLFDYDVSQNLTLNLKPVIINTPNSHNFGLSCSLRF